MVGSLNIGKGSKLELLHSIFNFAMWAVLVEFVVSTESEWNFRSAPSGFMQSNNKAITQTFEQPFTDCAM